MGRGIAVQLRAGASFGLIMIAASIALAPSQAQPRVLPQARVGATVQPAASLPAGQATLTLPNFDFELGGTSRWSKTGEAFEHNPVSGDAVTVAEVRQLSVGGSYWRNTSYPIGHHGGRWIGTKHAKHPAGTAVQGELPIGALTSDPIKLEQRYLTFLIGGTRDPERIRFELLEQPAPLAAQPVLHSGALRAAVPGAAANVPQLTAAPVLQLQVGTSASAGRPAPPPVAPDEVSFPEGSYRRSTRFVATGDGKEQLRREVWDVGALRGKTVRLRIVDDSRTGHINLDDIRFEAQSPIAARTAFRDGDVYRDVGFPLWGFADLHTHPLAHLGFGGRLLHGAPDGALATAMGNCNCTHGGWGLDNTCGNYIRAALVTQMDEHFVHKTSNVHGDHQHEGFPNFSYWPHFTTITHQQMRAEWIERAYQGGLRVIVALAVNNRLLADATDGDAAPHDDKASADLQLRETQKFVDRHPFMAIARTPAELRDIVRRDKLAVVLGVEVDDLGNFSGVRIPPSEAAVRAEVRRLYNDFGVRYIFPIHMTDNRFGGAAIYGDLFNIANRYNNTQPLPPEFAAWVPGSGFHIERASDPLITFRLKPHMDGFLALGIKGLIEGIEQLPSPYPFANCCTDFLSCAGAALSGGLSCAASGPPTFGAMLRGEHEYQVVKQFFLTPDPLSATYNAVPGGHRNAQGLSALGEVALNEMMRLGMLIDIDHMSEKSVERAIAIAEKIPGGYPLHSGHNGFRSVAEADERNENKRSDAQLARLQALGGLMGVGYGYHKLSARGNQVERVLAAQGAGRFTSSVVDNTCGGSARSFAQGYLYAIEKMGTVAFGSDANGMVMGPGPRYGEMSRHAGNYCPSQASNQRVSYSDALNTRAPFPIVQLRTERKAWDVNSDGVAHYGMLPDFLQDLSNVGVRPADLSYLFRGAEDFARSWERAVARAPR